MQTYVFMDLECSLPENKIKHIVSSNGHIIVCKDLQNRIIRFE